MSLGFDPTEPMAVPQPTTTGANNNSATINRDMAGS
jgi:hypothetical protein